MYLVGMMKVGKTRAVRTLDEFRQGRRRQPAVAEPTTGREKPSATASASAHDDPPPSLSSRNHSPSESRNHAPAMTLSETGKKNDSAVISATPAAAMAKAALSSVPVRTTSCLSSSSSKAAATVAAVLTTIDLSPDQPALPSSETARAFGSSISQIALNRSPDKSRAAPSPPPPQPTNKQQGSFCAQPFDGGENDDEHAIAIIPNRSGCAAGFVDRSGPTGPGCTIAAMTAATRLGINVFEDIATTAGDHEPGGEWPSDEEDSKSPDDKGGEARARPGHRPPPQASLLLLSDKEEDAASARRTVPVLDAAIHLVPMNLEAARGAGITVTVNQDGRDLGAILAAPGPSLAASLQNPTAPMFPRLREHARELEESILEQQMCLQDNDVLARLFRLDIEEIDSLLSKEHNNLLLECEELEAALVFLQKAKEWLERRIVVAQIEHKRLESEIAILTTILPVLVTVSPFYQIADPSKVGPGPIQQSAKGPSMDAEAQKLVEGGSGIEQQSAVEPSPALSPPTAFPTFLTLQSNLAFATAGGEISAANLTYSGSEIVVDSSMTSPPIDNSLKYGDTFYQTEVEEREGFIQSAKPTGLSQRALEQYFECGDVESYMKDSSTGPFRLEDVRSIVFQMALAFSLPEEREGLTHINFKCSSFGLKKVVLSGFTNLVLRCGLGAETIALRTTSNFIITPPDYETSRDKRDMTGDGDSATVMPKHFTMLVNTPPDFVIHGNSAKPGSSNKSWSLALSVFHLCNGSMPYEELMKDVKCPRQFKWHLETIFNRDGYSVIREAVDKDNHHQGEKNSQDVLIDTFYRILVLVGMPKDLHGERNRRMPMNLVYEAIHGTLFGDVRKGAKQFKADQKMYSFQLGEHPVIQAARAALETFPHGMDMWKGLTEYNPSERWTVEDVLRSEFMASVKEVPGQPSEYKEDDKVIDCFPSSTAS